MEQDRKICLDTETTGLYVEQGERIFEIGCVELIGNVKTDKTVQFYLNPGKDLSKESIEISGIDNSFLVDKPKFSEIVKEFLDFIGNSPIIAHNASFDMKFINNELKLLGLEPLKNEVIDTLAIARRKFPGQKATLDALCTRFHIDNSKRVFHGALLDADLLADVYMYLSMTIPDKLIEDKNKSITDIDGKNLDNFIEMVQLIECAKPLPVRKTPVDEEEIRLHEEFIKKEINKSLWDEEE